MVVVFLCLPLTLARAASASSTRSIRLIPAAEPIDRIAQQTYRHRRQLLQLLEPARVFYCLAMVQDEAPVRVEESIPTAPRAAFQAAPDQCSPMIWPTFCPEGVGVFRNDTLYGPGARGPTYTPLD